MIDILLATYNGEKYLGEQIDSIISQSYDAWRLIIRDDGSSDGTLSVINDYLVKYPHKITFIKDEINSTGATNNFSVLLTHSDGDYIMFCDHDDIWLPEKIMVTRNKMKALEEQYGKDIPLLVHTDLKVVDEHLNVLSDSFRKFQNLNPHTAKHLNRIIVQNVVTGCSLMINKKLKDILNPIPEGVIMHDWWIAITACAFGKIGYINESAILYRQHKRNEVGAREWGIGYILKMLLKKNLRENILNTQRQAGIFFERYKNLLTREDGEMINIYANLDKKNFFARRYYLFRYGFYKMGLIRNIGLFLLI